MPAVTVDNILILPRIPEPDVTAVERKVTSVTTAPSGFEGEGFPVRRAFAGVDLPQLDPFVHMDQMGEVDYGPGEPKGTPWHPHRGFETVTYIIDGTFRHQDSNGGGGLITDGDTQWMTAGGGILHIEAPPPELVVSGGLFHGIQLWVNLPARLKMTQPRYQDIRAGQVALLSSADGGALLRVIAGSFSGHDGPGITHTPISLVHGFGLAEHGHPAARRRADPGAGGGLRPVRHEHPGRAGPGLRGLPGGTAGVDSRGTGRAPPRPRRYLDLPGVRGGCPPGASRARTGRGARAPAPVPRSAVMRAGTAARPPGRRPRPAGWRGRSRGSRPARRAGSGRLPAGPRAAGWTGPGRRPAAGRAW